MDFFLPTVSSAALKDLIGRTGSCGGEGWGADGELLHLFAAVADAKRVAEELL